MIVLNWLLAHLTIAVFWQAAAFTAMSFMLGWMIHIQKVPDNGINFFELIYEPNSTRLSTEKFAFTGAFVITSVGFIFGVTRPTATVEGIATIMITYGTLWVGGVAVKRFADRPAAPPVAPVAPAAPTVVVQNQPQNAAPVDPTQVPPTQ